MKPSFARPTRRNFLLWGCGLVAGGLLAACGIQSRSTTVAPAITSPAATSVAPGTTPTAQSQIVQTPACVVRPQQTLGPYFVDEMLERSDIRSDPSDGSVKEGVPLLLVFNVSQLDGSACSALAGASVDVWHCDALGVYSDVRDPNFDTTGQKFLRGYQVTDANGRAEFTTIYPGWYQGRTVHVHFKIRTTTPAQQSYDFTSQLYFDDAITDEVHTQPPYASKGQRTLRNIGDGIYRNGGDQLTLQPVKNGNGYTATFDIGLQMG